jgi:hypothetical protein
LKLSYNNTTKSTTHCYNLTHLNILTTSQMTQRNQAIKALRSIIVTENIQTNPNQSFQDATLRPILKFQHETIMTLYHEYMVTNKINFDNLTLDQRETHN